MGYRKIQNLYKDIRILDFKECYALEKIHGTSAHITFKDGALDFFSGGASHEPFIDLFNCSMLLSEFDALGYSSITIYGEACGGKVQKMRHAYGDTLRFIAFEVKVGDDWQTVPVANVLATKLGLDFVDWERGEATLDWINKQRDKPSSLAEKLGLGEQMREGVVLRPIDEVLDYRGDRIITKHKRAEFRETKTKREIDPEKLMVLAESREVSAEWVTQMRLEHILDKMPEKGEMKHVPLVIKMMIEDVKLESFGEVEWSKAVEKAIGKDTVLLYKKHISKI